MTGFSPLAAILKENKLTGPNYVDWKRNLDIVPISSEYNVQIGHAQLVW